MKKEQFEQDMQLLKEKAPHVYHDIARVTSPLMRLYNELHTMEIEFLQEHYSLTLSELDILTSLFYSGGETYTLSPTKLMERLLFSSGGMTKILKKLESKELVCRSENSDDGRSKLVQLTNEGVRLAQDGLRDLLLFEKDYFSALKKTEKEDLSKLLLKCLKK